MKTNLLLLYKNKIYLTLIFFIIVYVIYFSVFTIIRHQNLYSMRYDLGNMVQTVWNTAHGDIFMMTNPEGSENISRFAFHADFFLIFLAPIYYLFPDPKTLLIIQAFLVGMSAIPLFLIAKKLLNHNLISLILVIIYLLNPSLQRANIYEFHAVTVVPLFLISAFYFMLQKRYGFFWLFFFLSSSTKEQIPLIFIWYGLYIIFKQKNWKMGLLTIIISLIWFISFIWIIIPYFREGLPHFGISFFSDFGDTPHEVISGFLLNPEKIITLIFHSDRLLYLKQLLLPLGFLPLFSPIILFSISEFLINLISNNQPMLSIAYQYTAAITPFLFLSTIYFLHFIQIKFKKILSFVLVYLLIISIYSIYLYGPLFFAKKPDNNPIILPNFHNQYINEAINLIPSSASLSVTNNIAPHFANRKYLFSFPEKYKQTEYIAILSKGKYENVSEQKLKQYVLELSSNKNYQIIYNKSFLYIFKKNNEKKS